MCLAYVSGNSQSDLRDGFVITLSGDTIRGKIDYKTYSQGQSICRLVINQISNDYQSKEVKGYGFIGDKFFSSTVVEGFFVEVLVLGEMSLYRNSEVFYIKKNDALYTLETKDIMTESAGRISVRKDSKWKGFVSLVVSDCLSGSELKELTFQERSLSKITIDYNKCRNSPVVVFKQDKPWTKVKTGIFAGFSPSFLTFNDRPDYLSDLYSTVSPFIGFSFAFSSPRVNENLVIYAEPYFSRSSFQNEFIYMDRLSPDINYKTEIQFTTVSLPLSLRRSISKKNNFYIVGGLNFDFYLRPTSTVRSEFVLNNAPFVATGEAVQMRAFKSGINGGLEYRKEFSKVNANVGVRYFLMGNILSSDDTFKGNLQKIMFTISVTNK